MEAFGYAPREGERLGPYVIVLLALVWAAVLVPSVVRARLSTSPADGVRRFEHTMGLIESTRRPKPPASGRWIMVPRNTSSSARRRARIVRRRRQMFVRMLAFAGTTLILGLLPHLHILLFLHVATDASIAYFVLRLVRLKTTERKGTRLLVAVPPVEDVAGHPDEIVEEVGFSPITLEDEDGSRRLALDVERIARFG